MSYNIINTDTSTLDINNLNLDNSLAPRRIKKKMLTGNTYNKNYDNLINYFWNPNELAESLTSKDKTKKKLAFELMNSKIEHIYRGIGWYLYNGKFIEDNHDKIVFVGSVENMYEDTVKLSNLLNIKVNSKEIIRQNNYKNDNFLSKKAIKNLLEFYKDTDYKALQKMVDYGFISEGLFKKYHYYN